MFIPCVLTLRAPTLIENIWDAGDGALKVFVTELKPAAVRPEWHFRGQFQLWRTVRILFV